jgi:hypothetical protein
VTPIAANQVRSASGVSRSSSPKTGVVIAAAAGGAIAAATVEKDEKLSVVSGQLSVVLSA